MARALVLCQVKNPETPKLQVRGVFSQKKKLWETIEKLAGDMTGWKNYDDVSEKDYDSTYATLCNRLRLIGRVTIKNTEGQRIFLIVDTKINEVRNWDTDEDGVLTINPVQGDEKEGE